MPPKKDVGKKTASSGKKPVVDKKASSSNENKPAAKPEKISFSFTASANLNDGGETAGNVPYLWVSKASMIRCALTYGDVVIVQSMKEGGRILATAAVQLMKGLKETEVLCSESLFRCISPTMDIVPVTVFRLAPNSFIADATQMTLSLHCPRNQLDRYNKDRSSTNSNQDFIHTVLMKLINNSVIKGQSVIFSYMGITVRGMISNLVLDLPPDISAEGNVLIGQVNHATRIQLVFQDDDEKAVSGENESNMNDENGNNKNSSSSSSSLNEMVGGLQAPKQQLQEILNSALFLSSKFKEYHITAPKGVLLYGPPGCGKTLLVRSLVQCYHVSYFSTSIASLLSQYLGESERLLTELFVKARAAAPSVVFLDEVDALCPPRDQVGAASSRLCSLLLSLFDEMEEKVIVIGATNRPNSLDSALRRPGRFDREIEVEVPNVIEKQSILSIHLRSIPHSLNEQDIEWLANHSNGFTGADLRLLLTEASLKILDQHCLEGVENRRENIVLGMEDVKSVLPSIRPSALREVAVTSPNVHWNDIGGLETVKAKMRELIEWPVLYASKLQQFNITPPKGVLLYGPPGCSKTLLAKAVATEANMNFISVKGPELYSKYVGESEQALAAVFRRARLSAPCVIFFDEIDAFASARSSTSGVTERVVSQFLTELDGIHMLKRVLVIAATNRPDLLDPALLRPGRLDTHIFLGLPDLPAREKILQVHLHSIPVDPSVCIREVAEKTEGYSGAELAAVCTQAAMNALDEDRNAKELQQAHLMKALTMVRARTSPDLLNVYIQFNNQNQKRS